MSDVLVAIYLFFFVAVFGATFAFMWRLSGSVLADMDKQPRRNEESILCHVIRILFYSYRP